MRDFAGIVTAPHAANTERRDTNSHAAPAVKAKPSPQSVLVGPDRGRGTGRGGTLAVFTAVRLEGLILNILKG